MEMHPHWRRIHNAEIGNFSCAGCGECPNSPWGPATLRAPGTITADHAEYTKRNPRILRVPRSKKSPPAQHQIFTSNLRTRARKSTHQALQTHEKKSARIRE